MLGYWDIGILGYWDIKILGQNVGWHMLRQLLILSFIVIGVVLMRKAR
jgi:hypothetical protein